MNPTMVASPPPSVEERTDPTATRPALSVIVPVYNGEATLGAQLEALAQQDAPNPWELLVVDDGSTDRSVEVAEGYRERLPLRVIRAPARGGAARARNIGARAAEGAYLAFVDADDVVAPGWLAAVVAALREHPAAASRFDTGTLNGAASRASRGALQSDGLQPYTYPAFLPHAGGSGLMVRRDVHERIGGFDEELGCLEDTDYTWRLQLAGVELHFEPAAVVQVRFREDAAASFRQAYFYGYHNVVLLARYRGRGMPRVDRHHGLRAWWRLLRPGRVLGLRDPVARTVWLRHVGWRAGRLAASIRHRIWGL